MTNQTDLFSRIRLVFKRSNTATKIAVLTAAVLSTVALLALHGVIRDTQEQTEALRQQAAQLEQENDALEDKIGSLGSVDSVEDIARDELGLVTPDSIVIVPKN